MKNKDVQTLIKSCYECKFHEVKQTDEDIKMSYCQRENMYCRYSTCVIYKAISRYLEQEKEEG